MIIEFDPILWCWQSSVQNERNDGVKAKWEWKGHGRVYQRSQLREMPCNRKGHVCPNYAARSSSTCRNGVISCAINHQWDLWDWRVKKRFPKKRMMEMMMVVKSEREEERTWDERRLQDVGQTWLVLGFQVLSSRRQLSFLNHKILSQPSAWDETAQILLLLTTFGKDRKSRCR